MAPGVVATFPSRLEAEVSAALLRSCGIRAWVLTDSAGGVEPQLEFVRGVRLVTDGRDVEEAAALLDVVPPSVPEPLSEDRERLVRVVRNVIFGVAAAGIALAALDATTR